MFTGIIEEIGSVRSITYGSSSIRISLDCTKITDDIKVGDSVAVNGVCLTVTSSSEKWFDVMPETMRTTNLGNLKTSDKVNLERALKLNDRLGGHLVSGHIDGIGKITNKVKEDNAVWLTIEASREILRYIVKKGSVALDGTSLTVAEINKDSFKVSLIPLTFGATTLGLKNTGDIVNIECDVIGKYVEKLIYGYKNVDVNKNELSMKFLKEHGFM